MTRAMFVAVLLLVPFVAQAANWRDPKAADAKPVIEEPWRTQAAIYMPGAYAFLDRLDLTKDQDKVLAEIFREWSIKQRQATEEVKRKMPPPSEEEKADYQKLRVYYIRCNELLRKATPEPPVNAVRDVLTIDQLDKIQDASDAVMAWNKWLETLLAQYDKKLDAILGAEPEKKLEDVLGASGYSGLKGLVEGLSLFDRLGLTQEQETKLGEVSRNLVGTYGNSPGVLARGVLIGQWSLYAQPGHSALADLAREESKRDVRDRVLAVLSAEQRDKLLKAAPIAEERDKAILDRYVEFEARFQKALPPRKG